MSTNAPMIDTDSLQHSLATSQARQIVEQIGRERLNWRNDQALPDAVLARAVYQLLSSGDIILKEYTYGELKERFEYYCWSLEQRANEYCWRSDGKKAMRDLCLFMEVAMNCQRPSLRISATYWGLPFHDRIMEFLKPSRELRELFDRTIGQAARK